MKRLDKSQETCSVIFIATINSRESIITAYGIVPEQLRRES